MSESVGQAAALAVVALNDAVEERHDDAYRIVGDIATRYGQDGLTAALITWARLAAGAAWGVTRPREVTLVMVDDETLQEVDTDSVPYAQRWAGRWGACVAADDKETAHALLKTAIEDDQIADCVQATLVGAGATIAAARNGTLGGRE